LHDPYQTRVPSSSGHRKRGEKQFFYPGREKRRGPVYFYVGVVEHYYAEGRKGEKGKLSSLRGGKPRRKRPMILGPISEKGGNQKPPKKERRKVDV